MPERSCSAAISRSRSVAMRSNSAIMPSIWATFRRLSSTWNFFRRMSVSRDFIDSYSPKAHTTARCPHTYFPAPALHGAIMDPGTTPLVLRFRARDNSFQTLITIAETGCLFLTLREESLEGGVKANRLVDLGAGALAIGTEPDQLLHICIGGHHLARTSDDLE